MAALRLTYDGHVRAFVEEWAPHETAAVLAHQRIIAASNAARLDMVAARMEPWMRIMQLWIAEAAPSRMEPFLVGVALGNRFNRQFDFVLENPAKFSQNYSQSEWDCLMP